MFETFNLDDPSHEHANYGPIFNSDCLLSLEDTCKDATSKGGIITTGGFQNTCQKGFGRFFEPTIIANVNSGMSCVADQCFGPIVGIQTVDSPGEASKIMNSNMYGQEAYIFTNDKTTID